MYKNSSFFAFETFFLERNEGRKEGGWERWRFRKWKEDKEHNGLLAVATENDCKKWARESEPPLLPSSTNYAKMEELGFFWLVSMIPIQMMKVMSGRKEGSTY